ncbi:MAG: hypothetical protein ACR2JE_03230 [Acidobacteriaceae bacterium]
MGKLAIVFGILVALVGIVGYALTHFWHAWIPIGLGLVLVILGFIANTPEQRQRMIAMHIAVTVGLLGFLGTLPGLVAWFRMLAGAAIPRPLAAEIQTATSLLCLIFVLLCVRSFVAARRARV